MLKLSKKILIYGDIDMNLIDGSSIWLTSLAEVLTISDDIIVYFLLKKSIHSELVIENIKNNKNIKIIDPYELHNISSALTTGLSRKEAVDLIEIICEDVKIDLVIVRGQKIIQLLSDRKKLDSIIIPYVTIDINNIGKTEKKSMYSTYENFNSIFVQTEETKSFLMNSVGIEEGKLAILSPMVTDYGICARDEENSIDSEYKYFVYSGKFDKGYNTDKIIDVFEDIENIIPECKIKLKLVGNKFFNLDKIQIRNQINSTNNITWYKGKTRKESLEIIENSYVGISWRSDKYNNSLEISTKLLEYGLMGKPVIMNKTEMHERIFGEDYPFYADTKDEFIEKLKLCYCDKKLYLYAKERMNKVSREYTYQNIFNSIKKTIYNCIEDRNINVLMAGHDFKFAKDIIKWLDKSDNINLYIDKWENHSKHDINNSNSLLEKADIIICEWGLGNVVWYSENKQNYQKLIVRIHLQEIQTEFINKYNYNKIDKVIVITPYMFEVVSQKTLLPREKLMMIYNSVNIPNVTRRQEENKKYNIGIMGICPRRKRLDLAIDIFESLVKKDKAYKLYIKGKKPQEYEWLWKREDEREYYQALFERINNSELLKDRVIFEEYSEIIDEWFERMGFILSTSDFEGSHQSVAEGMSFGVIPVIKKWEGSSTVYPDEYIFDNIEDMIEYIYTMKDTKTENTNKVKAYAKENFDSKIIISKWEKMIQELI